MAFVVAKMDTKAISVSIDSAIARVSNAVFARMVGAFVSLGFMVMSVSTGGVAVTELLIAMAMGLPLMLEIICVSASARQAIRAMTARLFNALQGVSAMAHVLRVQTVVAPCANVRKGMLVPRVT